MTKSSPASVPVCRLDPLRQPAVLTGPRCGPPVKYSGFSITGSLFREGTEYLGLGAAVVVAVPGSGRTPCSQVDAAKVAWSPVAKNRIPATQVMTNAFLKVSLPELKVRHFTIGNAARQH